MDARPLVLVVDDDAHILQFVALELTTQGCQVITCPDGIDALKLAEEQRPDLIILDLKLPKVDGLEILRRLREKSSVPVLLLTARTQDADKIRGLNMGADDYVTKPFSPDELTARVKAILRRVHAEDADRDSVVRSGAVEIDLTRRRVKRNNQDVSLTRTEWMLLQHLAANAGKVIVSSELLAKVWNVEYANDVQYLRVWISRLRHKLGDDTSKHTLIRTFPGVGYMLTADPEPDGMESASQSAVS